MYQMKFQKTVVSVVKIQAINIIIYLFIYGLIILNWLISSESSRKLMVYSIIIIFPILAFQILFKIFQLQKRNTSGDTG